jgi:hypothetical protein
MLRVVNLRTAFLAGGLLFLAAAALVMSQPGAADLPFPQSLLEGAATLDYAVPASLQVTATVNADQAIATARRFTNAPISAQVQSARLALWSDPSHKNIFVWAVHVEGLDLIAGGPAPINGPRAVEVITRSLVLVSPTEPGVVLGALQQARPN